MKRANLGLLSALAALALTWAPSQSFVDAQQPSVCSYLTREMRSLVFIGMNAPAVAGGEPVFEFKRAKTDDALFANKEGTTFTILSKSGIGGATINLTKGQWPKSVSFRFQYADLKPFKGLESFKLSTAKFKVDGSMKENGKMPYFVATKDGLFERKGTADVQVKQDKEHIDVTLPADLLKGVTSVELKWVDFYRD